MKYANIQVLRFFAALSVLLYHLGVYAQRLLNVTNEPAVNVIAHPVFAVGVMVFFAISGFVLTHSLQSCSVPQFLLLRLARIYPAYWVAVVGVLAVRCGMGQPLPPKPEFVRGMLLVPAGPGRAVYTLGVEWSLVYEMVFYFVLSLFALAGPRRGILIGTLIWFGLCLAHMVARPSYAWPQFPTWAEVILSPVNTPFLCGVLVYYLRHHTALLRLWAPAFVPALIAVSYLTTRIDWIVLAQGIAGGLIVGWAAATPPAASDHPLVRYGDFSYGVYLMHVSIIVFLFRRAAVQQWAAPALATVIAVGTIALLVGLVYGCVEAEAYRRFRHWLMKPQGGEEKKLTISRPARAA